MAQGPHAGLSTTRARHTSAPRSSRGSPARGRFAADQNLFTIHVVAQSVKDSGAVRPGIGKSGPGYSDPDDEILAESWMRTVVGKAPPATPNETSPRLEVLSRINRSSAE